MFSSNYIALRFKHRSRIKSETKYFSRKLENLFENYKSDKKTKSTECLSFTTKDKKQTRRNTMLKNTELAKELVDIDFPLKGTHIFSLACERCFIRISPGPRGCNKNKPARNCGRNKLIVKKITDIYWTEIRNKPHFFTDQKLKECLNYKNNKKCAKEPCSFAHGREEMIIWEKEQRKMFNLETFIAILKNHNIYTSEMFEKNKLVKYIPGLNESSDMASATGQEKYQINYCVKRQSELSNDVGNSNMNNYSRNQTRKKPLPSQQKQFNIPNFQPISKYHEPVAIRNNNCAVSSKAMKSNTEISFGAKILAPLVHENIPDSMLCEEIPGIKIKVNILSKSEYYLCVHSMENELTNVVIQANSTEEQLYLIVPAGTNGTIAEYLSSSFKIGHGKWKLPIAYIGNASKTFSVKILFDFFLKKYVCYQFIVKIDSTKNIPKCTSSKQQRDSLNLIDLSTSTDLMNKYNIPEFLESYEYDTKLSGDNYIETIHCLLYKEETAQKNIISRYAFSSEMKLSSQIDDQCGTFLNAANGTLFGCVQFSTSPFKDSESLIAESCHETILTLKSNKTKYHRIPFANVENSSFKSLQQNILYLSFNEKKVRDLQLKKGESVSVNIQFVMNRSLFVKMHYALDSLVTTDIVVPKTLTVHSENGKKDNRDSHLNENQRKAVNHIPSKGRMYQPPFVIIGSFGTGKTETLLHAISKVIENNSTAKILISTHTNSAADLFIVKYLHKYLSRKKIKHCLKRLYSQERRLETIPSLVQKYVINYNNIKELEDSLKDDESQLIVIATMEMCFCLRKAQGVFTHIFIDEAAQALESKVLLPLSLATKETCIVLSGDSYQIRPKVYSSGIAKDILSTSIINRLYNLYKDEKKKQDSNPPYIILTENYRCCKEIVNFLAYSFYSISHKMSSNIENPLIGIKAMQFYAVEGIMETFPDDMSYYNEMEMNEVCSVVQHVLSCKIEDQNLEPNDICVISNEQSQVKLIRERLKRKKIFITTDNVINTQGKEFKVVIISTVHSAPSLLNYEKNSCKTNFLDDKCLLNSAMSRAKYSVIVVGHPVALCMQGQCKYIWQNFIQNCSELESLYPSNITYDTIFLKVMDQMKQIPHEKRAMVDDKQCYCRKHTDNPEDCFPLLFDCDDKLFQNIYQMILTSVLDKLFFEFNNVHIVWKENKCCGQFCIPASSLKAYDIEFLTMSNENHIPDWFCIEYRENQSANSKVYYLHAWVIEVKCVYDNFVVELQVIDPEIGLVDKIKTIKNCVLKLIPMEYFLRNLLNSLINLNVIPPVMEMYLNEFDNMAVQSEVMTLCESQVLKYGSLMNNLNDLAKLLEIFFDYLKNYQKKQIVICSKEEDFLNVLESAITKDCSNYDIIRVSDKRTEEIFYENYLTASNTLEDSSPSSAYLHEDLLRKNELFRRCLENIKVLKQCGMNVLPDISPFQKEAIQAADVILCTTKTTSRTLLKELSTNKIVIIADADYSIEWHILQPLLMDKVHKLILFTK